jgi:hypothetical protein
VAGVLGHPAAHHRCTRATSRSGRVRASMSVMPLPGPVSHLQWRFIWALVSASNATSRRSWLHRLGSWLASAATNPEQLIQVVVADGQDDGRSGLSAFAPTLADSGHAVRDGGNHGRMIRRLGHWGSYSCHMITAADRRAVLEPVNGAETRRAGKHPVAAVNPHHEWRGRRGRPPRDVG